LLKKSKYALKVLQI